MSRSAVPTFGISLFAAEKSLKSPKRVHEGIKQPSASGFQCLGHHMIRAVISCWRRWGFSAGIWDNRGTRMVECLGRCLHQFWFLWFLECTKKTIINRIECHSSTRHEKENEKKWNVIKADILVNMKYLFGNPHHQPANHIGRGDWSTKLYRPTLCQVHFRCVLNRQASSSEQRRAFKVTVSSHKRIKTLGQIGWVLGSDWRKDERVACSFAERASNDANCPPELIVGFWFPFVGFD